MKQSLENRTVAITEHRFEQQFAALITRHGARVVSCPLLEERPVGNRSELQEFIGLLLAGGLDFMVFFTGVGARLLAEEAENMGESGRFSAALEKVAVVARGPKPRAALGKLGLGVDLAPEDPTSEGLLQLLAAHPIRGRRVGVQLYGAPNPEFCSGLERLGAEVVTVQVYNYGPASDRMRVREFIETLLSEKIDALAFTSAPQVDSLFDVADETAQSGALVERLNTDIAVAVIGSVTNRALTERGITARIFPAAPKMAPLADAIVAYFTERAS